MLLAPDIRCVLLALHHSLPSSLTRLPRRHPLHMLLPLRTRADPPPNILRHTTFEALFHVSHMHPAAQTHCVLLLDLPPSALAGIDLLSFTAAPRFKGIKNLPPGLHFVFASANSSLAVRHGAWFYVSPGSGPPQVFIKKWHAQDELLIAETSQTDVFRWRANLGAIWNDALSPYRQSIRSANADGDDDAVEESTDWSQLTSHISPTLLSRITGLNPDHWTLSSTSSTAEDVEIIPGLESNTGALPAEKELHFFPVQLKQTWRAGATGRERTEAAQDRSWALGDLIEKHGLSGNARTRSLELLGELQFCFLMVLTLNNSSCLEQWKRLLGLLLTCRTAIKERSQLFLEFLKTLRLQLSHCGDTEASMFDWNDQGGDFLKPLLKRFRQSLSELDYNRKSHLVEEFEQLEDFLRREFDWQLDDSYVKHGILQLEDGEQVDMDVNGGDADDETGEYAPTIVDLTPSQLEELNKTRVSSPNGRPTHDSEDETDLVEMDTRY